MRLNVVSPSVNPDEMDMFFLFFFCVVDVNGQFQQTGEGALILATVG